jgi:hypothetical protein
MSSPEILKHFETNGLRTYGCFILPVVDPSKPWPRPLWCGLFFNIIALFAFAE